MNLYFTALFKFVLSIYFLETLRVCVWRFQLRMVYGSSGGPRGAARVSHVLLRKAYTRV